MKRLISSAAFGAFFATTLIHGAYAADNFDAAAYFEGKSIRIQVGFAAGGGTDLQARHFAQHWSRTMPGNPTFNVTNITPNTASANRLYRSPPDGMTIEMTASINLIQQFMESQARFKIEENRMIGTHTGTASVLFGYRDLPYETLQDAIGGKTPIRVGMRSPNNGGAIRLAALSEWLDIPIQFVSGARGTADNLIALERRDTDAFMPGGGGTLWFSLPFIRPGWLKDGTLRPLALMGPSDMGVGPNTEIEMPSNVPYAAALIEDPENRAKYEIFANVDSRFGKVFMAPPKTPDNIIDAFRNSYKELLDDKPFRERLENMMGEPVTYTPGAEMEPIVAKMAEDFAMHADDFTQWIEWARKRF